MPWIMKFLYKQCTTPSPLIQHP
jgi:hypothetical protein